MSDATAKRWIVAVVFGIVLVFLGLTVSGHGPESLWRDKQSQNTSASQAGHKTNNETKSHHKTPRSRAEVGQLVPAVKNYQDTLIGNPNPAETVQRAKDDLKAQQEMAIWAEAMFWATLATVAVTFAGVIVIYVTLSETKLLRLEAVRANRAAFLAVDASDKAAEATMRATEVTLASNERQHDAFRSQQRAWLTLDIEKSDFESPFYWDDEKGCVQVKLVFRNFGKTPAYNAMLITEFAIGARNIDGARSDITKDMTELPLNVGYTVIPNEELPQRFTFSISREMAEVYIQQEIRSGTDEKKVDFGAFIVGCMTYELAFEGERRTTPFVVGIGTTPNNKWMSFDPRPELGEVSYQDLKFERWPVGDITPN